MCESCAFHSQIMASASMIAAAFLTLVHIPLSAPAPPPANTDRHKFFAGPPDTSAKSKPRASSEKYVSAVQWLLCVRFVLTIMCVLTMGPIRGVCRCAVTFPVHGCLVVMAHVCV